MISDRIQCVYFSIHTSEEIKTLAVKKVTNPQSYDELLNPMKNGLMDAAFGPNDRYDLCDTCGFTRMKCPGHFGYIELPLPVYHPMFFQLMLKILQGSCFSCHRLIAKRSQSQLFVSQMKLLDNGLFIEAVRMKDICGSAKQEASENSATEINLEEFICQKLDDYYNQVNERHKSKQKISPITKNLVQLKMELVKSFLKDQLKKADCPHCDSSCKTVRHEHNTRIYFKRTEKSVKKTLLRSKSLKYKRQNSSENQQLRIEKYSPEGFGDDLQDESFKDDSEREENTDSLNSKNLAHEYITPDEVKQHLIKLWKADEKVMECLLGSYKLPFDKKKVTTPEIFFLDVIAVPPTRFRPQSFLGDKCFENPQTENLNKILWHAKLVEEILNRIRHSDEDDGIPVTLTSKKYKKTGAPVQVPGFTFKEQLQNAWIAMQTDVNTFMDSTLNKLSREAVPGVRQEICCKEYTNQDHKIIVEFNAAKSCEKKKEGLFRKHMMGKRVNYACRSVISPDPYINTDEIGVPMVFASKLTYPQPVTAWNLNELKQMVINGPNKYPGATMVEYEDGRKRDLSTFNEDKRRAIANQLLSSSVSQCNGHDKYVNKEKKVYRHLKNGDIMLLNRQPTLHKPSIMAHKAKVLPGERTLRLHYANCKSYNADFDGDEMNAHFPQSELGRSEAYNIVSTNFNYLSPKDGKPLSGLIQDHVVSGVRLTSRDTLFNREDYQQLIFNALIDKQGRIKLLPPCILKPKPMWSGKQVFSSILLNILPKDKPPLNMNGNKAKISDENWASKTKKSEFAKLSDHPLLKESQVIIRAGELVTGVLDKTQYGATAFSLVHCVYEIYGGVTSGKLLSALARLFTAYLQHTGFTLGVEDILVLPPAEEKRKDILEEGRMCGDESALEAMNMENCDQETLTQRLLEAHFTAQGADLKQLDLAMKSRTDAINNKVNSVCMRGLLKKFPFNSLQLMVQSGAKGSSVNTMQISCLLGQIELEGRRPPLSMSGRSLPSFVPYDTSPRAGGFVDGRFLTGIRPQEYFFHCMAGREGLIDTAVKTSRSGYLQRCLIKHLEALYVQYDMTVRDGDGSIIQFLYGDDSVDVLKCQFLQKNQFKTIINNYNSYVKILNPKEVTRAVNVEKAERLQKKQKKWKRKHGEKLFSQKYSHVRKAPFHLYETECRKKIERKFTNQERKNGRNEADLKLLSKWSETDDEKKQSYLDACKPTPDPSLSRFNPACYFGAVSEKFRADVEDYVKCNPDDMLMEEDCDDSSDEEDKENRRLGKTTNKETFQLLMFMKYMKSVVEPGEAVGLLAGQSIGEPSTQMTLNTFHFAGRGEMNVTLGIPRLREILMTASETIKTPQMSVLVKTGEEEKARWVAKRFTKVTLMEVLKSVSVSESLERSVHEPTSRCREFTVRLELLPPYTYEDNTSVFSDSIMHFIETVFVVHVVKAVQKVIREKEKQNLLETKDIPMPENRLSITDGENLAPPDEPDDLADLSDDEDVGDGGADDEKLRRRRTQFTSYDDPEEQSNEMMDNFNPVRPDTPELPEDEETDVKPKIEPAAFPQNQRVANVLKRDRHITGYVFNVDNKWCEITFQFPLAGSKVMLVGIVEKLAEKAIVHSAPGIQRGMVSESKDPNELGRFRLKTEGVNIQELWKYHDILDSKTIYSNNIIKIYKAYGIEAARSVLIKEVQDVFKVYGIHIDPRHLSLIADYMTFEGTYKPFNRFGIKSNPFPFQKMSFETSMNFIKDAAAFGQPDELGSPSSRIIVGRVINQGTGMIDLLPKLSL